MRYGPGQRTKNIEKLDQDGYVKVSELSRVLNCTEVTLRRDLKNLDQRGLLKKVHGGAVKIGNNFVHNNVKEAFYQKLYEKMEIAKVAFDKIMPGETIIIDDASTCIHLAGTIANSPDKYLKVVTNSVIVAEKLLDYSHVEIMMVGGSVSRNLGATEGAAALSQLAKLQADKAFIGVNGIDFKTGITLTGYPQQKIKQKMMEISKESFILADSSKFGMSYMSFLCPINRPTAIITDKNVDQAVLEQAEREKIQIFTKCLEPKIK